MHQECTHTREIGFISLPRDRDRHSPREREGGRKNEIEKGEKHCRERMEEKEMSVRRGRVGGGGRGRGGRKEK